MNKEQIETLAEKYRGLTTLKGTGLLLPPEAAMALVKDLVAYGEMIMGCDGWRYIDYKRGWIVQDLGVDLAVEEEIAWDEMTPARNAAVILPFLAGIPAEIDLVSLQFNDVEVKDALMDALREQ